MNLNIKRYKIIIILALFSAIIAFQLYLFNKNKTNKAWIKNIFGNYVTADRSINNQLIANRKIKGEWETFKFISNGDNTVSILSSDGFFLSIDTSNNNQLIARNAEVANSEKFFLLEKSPERYSIMTTKGLFVNYFPEFENKLFASTSQDYRYCTFMIEKEDRFLNSYFSNRQLYFLVPSVVFLFMSLFFFHINNYQKLGLILLLFGSLGLRFFAILMDPHLELWDEIFHALVAKNMMINPFVPKLFREVYLSYNYREWAGNFIWVHKQPLFLWQMALSMKLFGINEFALRLPSALMMSLMTYFIYRIGKISINERVGFYGAFLYACSYFSIELTSGYMHTDHNDVAFTFYITASIWSWIEYERSQKKYWIFLIGVFAGCAVLNKWLPGLIVYSGWLVSILADKNKRLVITKYIHLVLSVLISIIIFLPWQVYIYIRFPEEARWEQNFNLLHILEPLDGHPGDYFWHLSKTDLIYSISPIIMMVALIFLYRAVLNKTYKTAFFTFLICIYLFFAIVATKMPAYTYVLCSLIYVALGLLVFKLLNFIIVNPIIKYSIVYQTVLNMVCLIVFGYLSLQIERIQLIHTPWKPEQNTFRDFRLTYVPYYKNLPQLLNNKDCILFCNSPYWDNIVLMFYTDYIAYNNAMISKESYENLKQTGKKVVTFDNCVLPDFMENDSTIIRIKVFNE